MWNFLLETWTLILAPHTPQVFIFVKWPSHQGCAVVTTLLSITQICSPLLLSFNSIDVYSIDFYAPSMNTLNKSRCSVIWKWLFICKVPSLLLTYCPINNWKIRTKGKREKPQLFFSFEIYHLLIRTVTNQTKKSIKNLGLFI